jgi:hypothetical protein
MTPPLAHVRVDEPCSAGHPPICTVGDPVTNHWANAGTHGPGGDDILHAPNEGRLILASPS